MNLKEALEFLSDGHAIISIETAKEVCEAVDVPFNSKRVVQRFKSDPVGTFKGLTMKPEHENTEGVDTLTLSSYVADYLKVSDKAGHFFGRGSQARAYAEEIKKEIKRRKEVKI